MTYRRYYPPSAICLAVTLFACNGSDAPSGPIVEEEPMNTLGPSFSQDVNPIFEDHGCTAGDCHGGGAGFLTLSSSVGENYSSLVSIWAYAEQEFLRVRARDATNSYLMIKLEGRQQVGQTMPIGRPALDSTDIDTIRDWIDSGALNN